MIFHRTAELMTLSEIILMLSLLTDCLLSSTLFWKSCSKHRAVKEKKQMALVGEKKNPIEAPLPHTVPFYSFSTPFFVLHPLISCFRAPGDQRAATQSPGSGRQACIPGDSYVYLWWQVCPFIADGGVCQEVFGLGAEPRFSLGVDACEGDPFAHGLSVAVRLLQFSEDSSRTLH